MCKTKFSLVTKITVDVLTYELVCFWFASFFRFFFFFVAIMRCCINVPAGVKERVGYHTIEVKDAND